MPFVKPFPNSLDALRKALADYLLPIGNLDPDGRAKMLERRYAWDAACNPQIIKALIEERDQLAARLAWLHGPESNNVDGWEWGIYRVRWLNNGAGSVAEVQQTLNDFSDLDAAMANHSGVPASSNDQGENRG